MRSAFCDETIERTTSSPLAIFGGDSRYRLRRLNYVNRVLMKQWGAFQADENNVEAYQEEEYDTVLLAVGRQALTDDLALKDAGVHFNPRNKKIYAENEQTNVPSIYAVGDVLEVRSRYNNHGLVATVRIRINRLSNCRVNPN